jgi:hypothetical protein
LTPNFPNGNKTFNLKLFKLKVFIFLSDSKILKKTNNNFDLRLIIDKFLILKLSRSKEYYGFTVVFKYSVAVDRLCVIG